MKNLLPKFLLLCPLLFINHAFALEMPKPGDIKIAAILRYPDISVYRFEPHLVPVPVDPSQQVSTEKKMLPDADYTAEALQEKSSIGYLTITARLTNMSYMNVQGYTAGSCGGRNWQIEPRCLVVDRPDVESCGAGPQPVLWRPGVHMDETLSLLVKVSCPSGPMTFRIGLNQISLGGPDGVLWSEPVVINLNEATDLEKKHWLEAMEAANVRQAEEQQQDQLMFEEQQKESFLEDQKKIHDEDLKPSLVLEPPEATLYRFKQESNEVLKQEDLWERDVIGHVPVKVRLTNVSPYTKDLNVQDECRMLKGWHLNPPPCVATDIPSCSEEPQPPVVLNPGASYEKTVHLLLTDSCPPDQVKVSAGFDMSQLTGTGNKMFRWSDTVTIRLIQPPTEEKEKWLAGMEEFRKAKQPWKEKRRAGPK